MSPPGGCELSQVRAVRAALANLQRRCKCIFRNKQANMYNSLILSYRNTEEHQQVDD